MKLKVTLSAEKSIFLPLHYNYRTCRRSLEEGRELFEKFVGGVLHCGRDRV
jgi:hypothetical protein